MQMVKIQILDQEHAKKAFSILVRRVRVDCYTDNIFILPESGLAVLSEMRIGYVELGRGGLDYAEKALRETAPAHV